MHSLLIDRRTTEQHAQHPAHVRHGRELSTASAQDNSPTISTNSSPCNPKACKISAGVGHFSARAQGAEPGVADGIAGDGTRWASAGIAHLLGHCGPQPSWLDLRFLVLGRTTSAPFEAYKRALTRA